MNILAINPWIYDFAAYDLWAKPLGFLYILEFLKSKGFKIIFLDCLDRYHPLLKYVENYKIKENEFGCGKFFWEQIPKPEVFSFVPRRYKRYGLPITIVKQFLQKVEKPDIIMITSSMTYWYLGIKDIITILKEVFKNTPIVVGGTYPILCPQHSQRILESTFIINQYVPYKLKEVFESLFGIKLDFSEQTLFQHKPYYDAYQYLPYVVLRRSWGCPFECEFCGLKKMYKGFFEKDYRKVFKEIMYFYNKGVKNFVFYDDALCFPPDSLKVLLKKIVHHKLRIKIHTPNGLHALFIDKELAFLFKESGFVMPRISFESSQPQIIEKFSYKVDKEILKKAIYNLRKAGYKEGEYGVYIIFAAPDQDLEILKKDILFCHHLGCRIFLADFSYVSEKDTCIKEPLLHNNSIFPAVDKRLWSYLQDIKNWTTQLNKKLA